jgi:hypothetical protein
MFLKGPPPTLNVDGGLKSSTGFQQKPSIPWVLE